MQCSNCGNTLLPDEEFCSECGQAVNREGQGQSENQSREDRAREGGQRSGGQSQSSAQQKVSQVISDIRSSSFFQEAVDFLKISVLKPAPLVSAKHDRQVKVPLIVIGVLILLVSLFTFIGMRVATSQISSFYGESFIPFSAFFNLFLILIGAFAIFFVLLALMNQLFLRERVGLAKLAHDYLALSVFAIGAWIFGLLCMFITLYEIGMIAFAIGAAILLIIPLYIFMVHVRNDNGKMDTFHSVLIYSVLAVVTYLIILRLLLTLFTGAAFGGFL